MYADLHVHTDFADGKNTPEEMVLSAIEKGLSVIGFSEHAYVPFDPGAGLTPESTLAYRREIARLKTAYREKITVLCGIEMDYDAVDTPAAYDYVIGSVHYLTVGDTHYSVDVSPEETLRCVNEGFGGDFDRYAEAYFEKVSRLPEKTQANIIGHMDLIAKFEKFSAAPAADGERYRRGWKSALSALSGRAILEINSGAVARGYREAPYPHADILDAWRECGGEVVLSSDAHSAAQIAFYFTEMAAIVSRHGLTVAELSRCLRG